MGIQPQPSPKIVFGPFEFDAGTGDVRKFGNRIHLQGKPLQILSVLIEQPGQLIRREELQRELWKGTTFVDFEHGLNAAVNKLRHALGDSADQPRYIETLPGRGYRFIAPIQRGSGRAVLEMTAPGPVLAEPVRPRETRYRKALAAAAVLLVVAIGGYALSRSSEPARQMQMTRFTVSPPAGFALEAGASRQSFALSPDGRYLAFTAMDVSGAQSLFLRRFDSLEPRLIAGTSGVHTMFWEPDSRSLFLTVQGKLRRVLIDGDSHDVLSESPSFLFSGAWVNPGKLLLATNHGSYVVPVSGGAPEPTTVSYRWPQMLPGGEHILSVDWDEKARRHRARVRRFADGGAVKDLLETDSRVLYTASQVRRGHGYLLYIRGGNLLAHPFDPGSLRITGEATPVAGKVYSFFGSGAADFSVSDQGALAYLSYAGRSQLAWVDREGRRVGTIGPADINVKSGRLSPDGEKMAMAIYDVERGAQNLWIFDTKTNSGRQLTLEPGVRDAPVWSPDSNRLAFLYGFHATVPQVRVRGLGEKDAEEALHPDGFQMPMDWSSDGRFIAYSNIGVQRFANETQGDLWVVDMARGRKPVAILNTAFHEANAVFSPDAKWLAFTSNESGRSELYLQAFEAGETPKVTGERFLVSRSGALGVRWRRDGRELFYLAFDGRVHAVPVRLSRRPEFGAATPLFSISTEARAAIHTFLGFDVSPDGQRFAIPVVSAREGPALVVVQNWEALLRDKR